VDLSNELILDIEYVTQKLFLFGAPFLKHFGDSVKFDAQAGEVLVLTTGITLKFVAV